MATKPKLALIPSAYKASKVYSVLPSDGVGDFDFSRPTIATRVNKDGLIETVSSNVPRLNYPMIDGVVSGCPSLLLEPQRSNSLRRTEEFDNSIWNKGSLTVTANQTISPDGSQTADKITPNATTGAIRIWQTQTTVASTYSLSFFVKYNGKQYVQLLFGSLLNSTNFSNFDLINGVVTDGTGNIEDYGNGWFRISLTASLNAATDQVYLWSIDNANASRGASSTGNGIDGYYVWGAQVEQGSYPTSYIPTNGGTVTRSAETCNNAGDVNTFNDSEGVLMAEISALADSSETSVISISNNSITEKVLIALLFGTTIRVEANMSSGSDFLLDVPINIHLNNKVCVQYKSNQYKVFVNGISYSLTQTSTTPSGLLDLSFDRGDGTRNFNGNAKQIQYFDTALTDTDLEELTSWTSFNEMAQAQLYTIQ